MDSNAKKEDYCAEIGSDRNEAGGKTTIHCGTVTVQGGYCAANIGGGKYGEVGHIKIIRGTEVNTRGSIAMAVVVNEKTGDCFVGIGSSRNSSGTLSIAINDKL